MCNGACRREANSQDVAVEYWRKRAVDTEVMLDAYREDVRWLTEDSRNQKAQIERYKSALETIVRESTCRGVNCDWGDDCYAVIAHKALMGGEVPEIAETTEN